MTDNAGVNDGLFVAGTGTGVGKTVITAGLTGWLRNAGLAAHAIKPAQTGAPEDDDAGDVIGHCEDPDAATCLRRFEPALAPRVAAVQSDRGLDYEQLLSDVRTTAKDQEFTIVEGIGGVRVPLAEDAEVIDLAEALGYPALVVARSGLGTLNHTALTVEALESRTIPVTGIVLNQFDGATEAERTNPQELTRMTGHEVATIPPLPMDRPGAVIDGVRTHLPLTALPATLSDITE